MYLSENMACSQSARFSLLFVFLISNRATCNVTEATELVEEHYEGKGSVYAEDLAEAGKFLNHFDTKADELMNNNAIANWDYETDLTEENLQKTIEIGLEVSDFFLKSSENASQIKTLDLPNRIQRQISWIRRSADPTSDEMRREIKETIGKMTSIFGKGKVNKKSKNYTLNELTDILRTSQKRSELDWAWKSWRDTVGPPIKSLYGNLVDLLNIGAREHGWIDYGNYLRSDYEMGDDFELSLDKVWNEIEPLYQELHAYVRYKLSKHYKYKKNGCMPANIMGDMFAQNWENIFHLVKPKADSRTFDVTKELKKQKYTVKKMFQLAESFFVSLGLYKMPDSFWEKSVFTKPKNKEMVCHASAWDVSNTDVRIKMCTKVRQSDLTTVHHEMGHIEYYLAYKDQPSTFRAGANPGFHEAIGDTISLSVETSSYLDDVGLLKTDKLDKDDTISFLLNQALRRVAPIPYNLLVDKWRWRVFEGNITENAYNREWWKLRVRYQGVEPPVMRPESSFDPASKYHIGANSPYISYFVSYVLQFQLHKAFCKEAGYKGPLHACSIYKSETAGKKLRKMLEAGRSEPWSKILKEHTGDRDLKANAILQYFEPLSTWLKEQRAEKKYPLGWKNKMSTQVMQKRTKKYEAGQERSGILKTNSGDVSLSINIPTMALNEILGKSDVAKLSPETKEKETSKMEGETAKETKEKSDSKSTKDGASTKGIDLAKLLTSGNPVSIKSIETSTMGEKGNAEKTIKEIAIDSLGAKAKGGDKSNVKEGDLNEQAIASLISALRGGILNNSHPGDQPADANNPSAAKIHPTAKFPSLAASPNEEKVNPKTAGIKSEPQNPSMAGIPQEPKSNYVPSNQIALVPISLPNSILSQLQNVMGNQNATTSNTSTSGLVSPLPSLSPAASNSTDSASSPAPASSPSAPALSNSAPASSNSAPASSNSAPALSNSAPLTSPSAPALSNSAPVSSSSAPAINNTVTNEVANHVSNEVGNVLKNDTNEVSHSNLSNDTKTLSNVSTPANVENARIEKERKNESLPLQADAKLQAERNHNDSMPVVAELGKLNQDNSSVVVVFPQSSDNKGFISKQTVTPCKRSDKAPCFESKVVTEGNSIPTDDTKSSKGTVSISPSVLIQKLIEHKVAEKSTPEPVVNIIPDDPNNKKTRTKPEESDKEVSKVAPPPSTTEVDINKLIKALTGGSSPIDNSNSDSKEMKEIKEIKESKEVKETKETKPETTTGKTEAESSNKKAVTETISATNCSSAKKRGFSINFDCPDTKHKGGTLSISPTELLQKLLGPKSRSDIDKKTLPSAHVVKTDNGFQLNFDLNTKDKIPADFSIKMTNPQGRQQHVDVLNTPKGMVVKPKSSLQLLTPLFVPVQNKDIVELGKDGR